MQRGGQDSVGSHIKQIVGMAVLRGEVSAQCCEEMFHYLDQNFCDPVSDKSQVLRQVFFYVAESDNHIGRQFQSMPENCIAFVLLILVCIEHFCFVFSPATAPIAF